LLLHDIKYSNFISDDLIPDEITNGTPEEKQVYVQSIARHIVEKCDIYKYLKCYMI